MSPEDRQALEARQAELRTELVGISHRLAAARPIPSWAAFLLERLPGGTLGAEGLCLEWGYEARGAIGRGCPEQIYGETHYIGVSGAQGPGMIRALRAVLELAEARERGEVG